MDASPAPPAPLEASDNARRDLQALQRIGVLRPQRTRQLQRLRELRRLLVHVYATATAEQVHEAARLVADEFAPFYDAYRAWIAAASAPSRQGADQPSNPMRGRTLGARGRISTYATCSRPGQATLGHDCAG